MESTFYIHNRIIKKGWHENFKKLASKVTVSKTYKWCCF